MLNLNDDSLRSIIDSIHDGLYFVDRKRRITYWNKAAEDILGFAASEVIGRCCADNILTHIDQEGNCLCLNMCPLAAAMQDNQERDAQVYLHHKDGHRVLVAVRTSPLRDATGNVVGGIELFHTVEKPVSKDSRFQALEKLAYLDALTQLGNRNYLNEELERRFQEFTYLQIPFGILFMDIDHFKIFNDTYGHDLGDKVLVYVAKNLAGYASEFDHYGRWGGEEFIGIIRNVNPTSLQKMAEDIRLLVSDSYLLHEGEKLSVSISIGGTIARPGDSQ